MHALMTMLPMADCPTQYIQAQMTSSIFLIEKTLFNLDNTIVLGM